MTAGRPTSGKIQRGWRACALPVLLLVSTSALARSPDADEPTENRVVFRADAAEADAEQRRVELKGDVEVSMGRYRFSGQRLILERRRVGWVVLSDGRIALCPCPDPPLTLSFDSATLRAPGELSVTNATLRVGETPVMWLPYLQLRSAEQVALLPAQVAWRGDDGLLLGTGVHLPIRSASDTVHVSWRLAGYSSIGFDTSLEWLAPRHTGRLRWDHKVHDLFEIDVRGADRVSDVAGVSWDVDAVRGVRGRRATLALEPAARRYDRAELGFTQLWESGLVSTGGSWRAPRGGVAFDSAIAGPTLTLSQRLVATRWMAVQADMDTLAVAGERRSVSWNRAWLGASAAARPGPMLVAGAFDGSVSANVVSESPSSRSDAIALGAGRAQLRASVPLVRDYAAGNSVVRHWLEPFAQLGAIGGRRFDRARPSGRGASDFSESDLALENPALSDRHAWAAALGTTSSLGRLGSDFAVSANGQLAAVDAQWQQPFVGWKLLASGVHVALASSGVAAASQRSIATTSRLRIGALDRIFVGGFLDGQYGPQYPLARSLLVAEAPARYWFDAAGWTLGKWAGVSWTNWLASTASAQFDVSSSRLLALATATAYRHPCACLALAAFAGWRAGRSGPDLWLTLDIAPE